ncbi:MAG: Fe(2+)-trafficking protein [Acidobacteriota bacterium]
MGTAVSCSRCGQTREAISGRIPFRAELKAQVVSSICQQCWDQWLEEQVKVINELALNLGDRRSHEIIEQNARQFLGFSDNDAA